MIEGAEGEADVGSGFDDIAGLDRRAGLGEEVEKPVRAELGVGGRCDLGRMGEVAQVTRSHPVLMVISLAGVLTMGFLTALRLFGI